MYRNYRRLTNPLVSTLTRYSFVISSTLTTPAKAMQSLISSMNSFKQSSTPACPLYARPQSTGLPIQTKSAPSARALKTSVPCLTPPST